LIGNTDFHVKTWSFQPAVLLHVHSFGHFEPVTPGFWIFDWTILKDIGVRAALRKSPFRPFNAVALGPFPDFDLRNCKRLARRGAARGAHTMRSAITEGHAERRATNGAAARAHQKFDRRRRPQNARGLKKRSAGDPAGSPGRSCTSMSTSAVRRRGDDEPSTWRSSASRSNASPSSCGGRCPNASQQSSPSPCEPASLSSLQSWPCFLSLICPVDSLPKKRIVRT
jgi:hypothetical protein